MNRAAPENQASVGTLPLIAGADPRYSGCIRKFYGMSEVLDLDGVSGMSDIDAYDGPSWFKAVTFHKKGTTSDYRGFIVRWDSQDNNEEEQVDLIYTEDNGSTWSKLAIWATGNSISNTDWMDAFEHEDFLYIFCEGLVPKVVYYDSDGGSIVAMDSGVGDYTSTVMEQVAMEVAGSSVSSDYFLRGNGEYQVAFRFYDSTRGIRSALSDRLTFRLDRTQGTKAYGSIGFLSAGSDSGRLVDGDLITIWSGSVVRVYEADDDDSLSDPSYTQVDISGNTSIEDDVDDLVDTINANDVLVYASSYGTDSIQLEARYRGSYGNNIIINLHGNDDLTAPSNLSGGRTDGTGSAETNCKATLSWPSDGEAGGEFDFDEFKLMFDKIDVFRSIDLGQGETSKGAVLYLEQTIDMPAAWPPSNVSLGSVHDEALPFYPMFDPEEDIVTAIPSSGAAGLYQGLSFVAQAAANDGGYDTYHSSPEHESPEYFTTYNRHEGSPRLGRPMRYLAAGDAMFILAANSITHVYQPSGGRPLEFVTLHVERGLLGKEAAHTAGNTVFMISGMGLMMLNSNDGSMGQITAVDRVLFDDWVGLGSTITSAYDALLNASLFLCPSRKEVIMVGHSTKSASMLEGANFVAVSSTQDISDGSDMRAYFITATGLIVTTDIERSGSGSMWGLDSSYTLNGALTHADSGGTILSDSDAVYHADMVGALLYMTSGTAAGQSRTITAASPQSAVEDSDDKDFNSAPDWSIGNSWTVAGGVATGLVGELHYGADLLLSHSPDVGPGRLYKIVVVVNSDNSSTYPTGGFYVGFDETTWSSKISGTGTHTVYVVAPIGTFYIRLAEVAGYTCELESCSITSAPMITVDSALSGLNPGDTYAISPVPVKMRLWPLYGPQTGNELMRFRRWKVISMTPKIRYLSGHESNPNNRMRMGAYRNSSSTIESEVVYVDLSMNPSEMAGRLNLDGIDIEPYLEHIGCGTMFEFTNLEVGVTMVLSKKVSST